MPRCPHRPPCPGCPRFGAAGWPPAARRRLDALAEAAGLPRPVLRTGPLFGWRHRARLAVRGRAASPKIGLFQAGSHRIVDTPRCPLHQPLINRVAGALRDAIRATRTPPYRDGAHRGLIRYVQIVVERGTGTAQVVLVCNAASPESALPLAEALQERLGDALQGLFWNGQPSPHNVILGPAWAHLAGAEAVRERIAGVDVFFPPGAFGQANLPLADALVEHVAGSLDGHRRIVDLYAGSGAFGLPLLARGAAVDFAERTPDALRGLATGLATRPPAERARARVHGGDVGRQPELAAALDACDATILDPPRKGADAGLVDRLASAPPEAIVYVSCGLPALVRQHEALLAPGRLALVGLEAWALLPHTEHVETVARYARR